ncbi:MAG: hypothetical protein EAZ36_04090, partial [Verrucomicrobia bacterium]
MVSQETRPVLAEGRVKNHGRVAGEDEWAAAMLWGRSKRLSVFKAGSSALLQAVEVFDEGAGFGVVEFEVALPGGAADHICEEAILVVCPFGLDDGFLWSLS